MFSMTDTLIELTTVIASNFIERNRLEQSELPDLIKSIHKALNDAVTGPQSEPEPDAKPTAAQIKKSITPDALISFIDGRGYKTLKRHLTTHGETIESYKAKYGLPRDYPTTAPNYSAARSAMAKSLSLGKVTRAGSAANPEPETPPAPARKPGRVAKPKA